jgi:pimeloyl-ACP methyl ester carboxylesterase
MTAPRSVQTRVGGVRLHHLDWDGTGVPVVCLHGLTRNAHDFDALARALLRGVACSRSTCAARRDDWAPVELVCRSTPPISRVARRAARRARAGGRRWA